MVLPWSVALVSISTLLTLPGVGALQVNHNWHIQQEQKRPILFVKTHKTGGSTITNIIHRVGEARGFKFLLPENNKSLGWPGPFPGAENNLVATGHGFDIICNHAVYNHNNMLGFLRENPKPFVFTILRNPVAQIESTFQYFFDRMNQKLSLAAKDFQSDLESVDESADIWDQRIHFLHEVYAHTYSKYTSLEVSLFRNPQASDLGWYENPLSKARIHRESLSERLDRWIYELGLDFVMITEHFNEGLVLLRQRLGLSRDDIRNLPMKRETYASDSPTPRQLDELQDLLKVDLYLYNRFNATFLEQWENADGYNERRAELEQLRSMNTQLLDACQKGDKTICPWRVKADNKVYTGYLKTGQIPPDEMLVGSIPKPVPSNEPLAKPDPFRIES